MHEAEENTVQEGSGRTTPASDNAGSQVGQLPRPVCSGVTHDVVITNLNVSHIKKMIKLQSDILCELPENQTLIHVNTEKSFGERVSGQNKMVGILTPEGQLVAQLSIARKSTPNDLEIPQHLSLIHQNSIYAIEGILVHPDYRGKGFMDKMLSYAIEVMKKEGASGFYAEVDVKNVYSIKNLLKNGFVIDTVYIDPSDNGETYLTYRSLTKKLTFSKDIQQEIISIARDSFEDLKRKLSDNFCGVAYNKDSNTIIIQRCSIKVNRVPSPQSVVHLCANK